ncbi:helix-turn-helix domain-containing protein [Vreelandella sp. F11]|uniref:helix-turn-helix domain-containing protein n=1 Tax=Vreelandella sp. F11 TaxID=3394751 RepID=UPI0036DB4B93
METTAGLDKPYIKQGMTSGHSSLLIVQELKKLSQSILTLRRKKTLLYQGDPFQGLYIVQCGMLKQTLQCKSDNEQLTHFFLPDEIIGLDAIGEGFYAGTIIAIETSGLLHIPFRRIEEFPNLQTSHMQLLRCLSQAMSIEHSRMWQMISQPADVRLAIFFAAMSRNFFARGYSPYSFRLAMSRQEMADYLCMAVETLSRLISRFQQQEILTARGHEYCIVNPDALASIAAKRK